PFESDPLVCSLPKDVAVVRKSHKPPLNETRRLYREGRPSDRVLYVASGQGCHTFRRQLSATIARLSASARLESFALGPRYSGAPGPPLPSAANPFPRKLGVAQSRFSRSER